MIFSNKVEKIKLLKFQISMVSTTASVVLWADYLVTDPEVQV
jgi:hypothetical protein